MYPLINYPKITVATPTFNIVKYVEQTIVSVISQGYPNLEYIVVDAGSTDGTVDIIRKYEKYLSWWVSEPDKGRFDALNKAFSKSDGSIMGVIPASDIYLGKSLFTVASVFNSFPEVDWIVGIFTHIDQEEGKVVYSGLLPRYTQCTFLMNENNVIQAESSFWRRNLYNKVGCYNAELKYGGDIELFIKFLRYAKLYSVKTLIGAYRWHCESMTKEIKEEVLKIRKNVIDNEFELYPNVCKKVKKMKKLDSLLGRFPILRSIYWRGLRDFLFNKIDEKLPPFIVWDSQENKWVFSE